MGGSGPWVGGLVWGVSAPGGVSAPRGVWSDEGISQHTLRQTPLPPVDRQTPVKILPWPNFVAAGNEVYVINLKCKLIGRTG